MRAKYQIVTAVLGILLFCGITLAQQPTVTVDKQLHPNLEQAQEHIAQANQFIEQAQKDNGGDMQGHAARARQLVLQADKELKAAAESANAANAAKRQEKESAKSWSEPSAI